MRIRLLPGLDPIRVIQQSRIDRATPGITILTTTTPSIRTSISTSTHLIVILIIMISVGAKVAAGGEGSAGRAAAEQAGRIGREHGGLDAGRHATCVAVQDVVKVVGHAGARGARGLREAAVDAVKGGRLVRWIVGQAKGKGKGKEGRGAYPVSWIMRAMRPVQPH